MCHKIIEKLPGIGATQVGRANDRSANRDRSRAAADQLTQSIAAEVETLILGQPALKN
ncbi:MAG: hypothetical protein IAG10_18170 [Planctomycetaceae bacterium]|nr:hypothetical protein [Planctomycetaceae bacterium]